MRLPRVLLPALALLGFSILPSTALAAGEGVIEGRLVNGTAGAGPPAGAQVTLYTLRDRTKVGEQSQQVDAQGGFRFDGLDTDPSLVHLLVAEHHGILYPHPQLLRLSEQSTYAVEPRVYETTRDPTGISLERANILVTAVDASVAVVMEMGAVNNAGDRTYVGDGDGVLRLHLPRGASEVSPETGLLLSESRQTESGLVTQEPIAPGRHQIALRYVIPIDGTVLDLSKRLEYPVGTFNLYLPQGGLQASSPQLLLQGGAPVEMGGRAFQVYVGQDLPAETQLVIRVSGLPSRGWELTPEQQAGVFLAGGLLLAALAALLSWRLRRGRSAPVPAANGHQPADGFELERIRLVMELAELDERFAAGELPEEHYREQRSERKRRLVSVTRQAEVDE